MVTLLITINYIRYNFQEFIEKPREFIEFYRKYDYFHFRALLAFMNAAHFVRISESDQRARGERDCEAMRDAPLHRREKRRESLGEVMRKAFIYLGGRGRNRPPSLSTRGSVPWKNFASLVSAPSAAGPDSTEEGEFGFPAQRAR
ncbi:MAG: hypothetical protein OXG62_15945 [Nitrospinae bacterium]|nr:hypothetical protein [Nitrospinota bacterium]